MEPTRTTTITVQPQATVQLKANLKPQSFVYQLMDIIETIGDRFYAQWKDPLSLELMNWATEIVSIDLADAAENEEEFIDAARIQLIRLVNEIMVDTLFKKPGFTGRKPTLRVPVLVVETKWTCEKQFITECGHSKELTLVTHYFAVGVLSWALRLVTKSEDGAIINLGDRIQPSPDAYALYRYLVITAYAKHQLSAFITETQQNSEMMKIFREMIAKKAQEDVKQAEENAEKSLKELEARIAQIEITHQETTKILHVKTDGLEKANKKKEEKILKLQEETVRQYQDLASLQLAIYQAQQRIRALEDQLNKKKKPWYRRF